MVDSFVCIDLETTGLNPKTDRIIEIGAVKVENWQIVDTFQSFVNPERELTQRVTELTGITGGDTHGAPKIQDIFPMFHEFLGDYVLLGHSVNFDYAFLKKAAVNQRFTFEKRAVDTLKLARWYLSGLEHKNLEFLCEYYAIPHQAHRALEDAKATVCLYERLVRQFFCEKEAGRFEPFILQYQVKRDTPATNAQKERLYGLIELHHIQMEQDVEGLTRSEASRITDKILLKYGRSSLPGGRKGRRP